MPIQATFQADFTDFQRAVTDAETSLRSFEESSAKVEGSLNRMVDSFSGRKVISEATLMVEAIERIGGVSKLTEAELAKAGATAATAAEKMKALGMDVPPGMQTLADTTKNVGTETSKTTQLLGGLAGQLAGMFTIGAVVAFGKEVLETAERLQKMSAQTGLAVEQVQRLQGIAGQSGTEMSSMVRAIQDMQEKLGSGDEGLIGGLRQLGIDLAAFKTMNAYDQFIAIGTAIGKLEDPQLQAAAAAKIFGNNFRELLPALKSDMQKLADETNVMSEEAQKGLAALGSAWDRLKATAIASAGEVAGALIKAREKVDAFYAPSFNQSLEVDLRNFGTVAESVAATLDKLPPPAAAANRALQDITISSEETARVSRDLDRDMKKLADDALKAAEDAARKYAEELAKFEDTYARVNEQGRGYEAILSEIDGELVTHISKLLEAGASVDDLALAYSLSKEQVGAVKDKVDDTTAALGRHDDAIRETIALQDELYLMQVERSGTSSDIQRAHLQLWADNYKQRMVDAGTQTQEAYDLIDQIVGERTQDMMVDWDLIKSYSRASLQETADQARANYEAMAADSGNYSFETIAHFEEIAIRAQDAADNWSTAFNTAADDMEQAAGRASLSWSEAMDLVAKGQGTMTGQISLGDDPAGAMASWVDQLGNIGRLAGPINKAPAELFPADPVRVGAMQGGGTTTMTNTFNVNGTGADIARTVSEEITRLMRVGRKWPAV